MDYIRSMHISVSEAKAQLTDLVRRAEAGDEIMLTRHGQAVVRLVPVKAKPTSDERARLLAEFRRSVRDKAKPGVDAARSADFLYGEDGMPA